MKEWSTVISSEVVWVNDEVTWMNDEILAWIMSKDSINRYMKRLGTRSVIMKEVRNCLDRLRDIDRDAMGIRWLKKNYLDR